MNAPMKPNAIRPHSCAVNENSLFIRSKPVAAAMVGTASRKENTTADLRSSPAVTAPIIVAAARDTPGMTETAWKSPIRKAFFRLNFSIVIVFFFGSIRNFSQIIKNIPPRNSDQSTMLVLPRRNCFIKSYKNNPTNAVGMNAVMSFSQRPRFVKSVFR